MKPETLKRLIDEYVGQHGHEGLGSHISIILDQEKRIGIELRSLYQKLTFERDKFQKTQNEIQEKIATIQKECPHWEISYCGDPAGGSDSYNECVLCKKRL